MLDAWFGQNKTSPSREHGVRLVSFERGYLQRDAQRRAWHQREASGDSEVSKTTKALVAATKARATCPGFFLSPNTQPSSELVRHFNDDNVVRFFAI